MMGRNHVIVGLGLYLAVDWSLGSGGSVPLVNCLGVVAVASLAPDLDSPKSSLGRRFWPVSRTVSSFIGHRGFTHSLVASFLVFLGLAVANQHYPDWFGYFVAFGVGYVSHIVADWVTTEGVPLLWPNRKRFRSPLSFRTGGPGEFLFSLAAGSLLVVCLYRIFI